MMKQIHEMTQEVLNFLSKYGNMPAIKKHPDDIILKTERRLYNKFLRLQMGLESEFIRQLRELGILPSRPADQKALIYRVFGAAFENMFDVAREERMQMVELGRQLTIEDLKNFGIQVAFTAFSEIVKREIEERLYEFSKSSFEAIVNDFVETLSRGYTEGKGINEIAKDLRRDFKGLREYRLRLIARQEVQGAQNVGINETMKDYDVEYKQWLTVGDSRVRGRKSTDKYNHVVLHGQVVRYDEPFSNGLMYPTDRRGPIGEWINCRCRMRPYIPGYGEVILTTPYYP